MSITIELPYPPSVNNYWQVARNRIIKTKQARIYKKTIDQFMMMYATKVKEWDARKYLDYRGVESTNDKRTLALAIAVHHPKRRGPNADIDNLIKVCVDSLEGILFANDRQFRHIQISNEAQTTKEGLIRITIKECPDELEVHDGTFTVKGIHS